MCLITIVAQRMAGDNEPIRKFVPAIGGRDVYEGGVPIHPPPPWQEERAEHGRRCDRLRQAI